ncbi:Soyasaponin III rhamnosyltransferase [Bertholletia excelsa]
MGGEVKVVMLPFLAFGHLIPFHHLATALAKAGVHVIFVSTPNNIRRLPKLPQEIVNMIEFIQFPLPESPSGELLVGAEATVDLPYDQIQHLKSAYDLLVQPCRSLVADRSPNWIIADVIPHWAADVARDLDIPLILFNVFTAATLVFLGPPEYLTGDGQKTYRSLPESFEAPPRWVDFPSSVAFRNHEAVAVHAGLYGKNASGIADAQRLAKLLQASQAIAVRSCKEIENEYLNLYVKITNKPVIPVGLLLPDDQSEKREITDEKWIEIFKWLDEQAPKSVVFVGFGSELKLTREQIHEIAYGLELSEVSFLWALRETTWATDGNDLLPLGFNHRTSEKGRVCIGWAPQREILAHPSIGGTLFHSGWGTIMEALMHGHRLIAMPFILDQGLNARLLVDKGLAIEVEREEDGSFNRNGVAQCLRRAMEGAEGERLKVRAEEAAAIFSDRKLQDQYVADFVDYLRKGPRK